MDSVTQQKDAFVSEMKQQRDAIQVKIEALKAKADKQGAKSKSEINAEIAKLDDKKKNLNSKLDELGQSTGAAWQDLKKVCRMLLPIRMHLSKNR